MLDTIVPKIASVREPILAHIPASVLAALVLFAGLLGGLFGVDILQYLRYQQKVVQLAAGTKTENRSASNLLFPKRGKVILESAKVDLALKRVRPVPCATDSYLALRPSAFDEGLNMFVGWSFDNEKEIPDSFNLHDWNAAPAPAPPAPEPILASAPPAHSRYRGGPIRTSQSYTNRQRTMQGRDPLRPQSHSSYPPRDPISMKDMYMNHRPSAGSTNSPPEFSPFYAQVSSPPYELPYNPQPQQHTSLQYGKTRGHSFHQQQPIHHHHHHQLQNFSENVPQVQQTPPTFLTPEDLFTTGPSRYSNESEWFDNEIVDELAGVDRVTLDPSVLSIGPDSNKAMVMPTPEHEVISPVIGEHTMRPSGARPILNTVPLHSPELASSHSISMSASSSRGSSPFALELANDIGRSNSMRQEEGFLCHQCGVSFRVKGYLTRHLKKHAETKAYTCPFYDPGSSHPCHPTGGFSRRDTYKTHLKSRHFIYPKKTPCSKRSEVAGRCAGCNKQYSSNETWAEQHIQPGGCPALEGIDAGVQAGASVSLSELTAEY